ncbi:S-adenosyl-L-methionine-dependent methyltransferase [Xylaria bambusicola]|uniref:S-adenosyl-L-methionine-dependent methyltransferase n=1 Tax=Xylaria bambusicola TaxID=326684 RepID=UPI0020074E6F|nr:S-adenosyl-L-methionine-dependent methyltransferase [Xylaria bambusicola]KAI0508577.1 S-adenosyl-L-methionine-dependent methyltransferase [Xylaria bambusicola]
MSLKSSTPEAIQSLVHRITQAANNLATVNGSLQFESESARRELVAAAEQLLLAVRSPEENIFSIAQQPAQNAALRCAIALGVPDALPANGDSCSLDDLSRTLKAEKTLLSRILRACVATSTLSEPSELCYAHNAVSRTLLSSANRALLTLMYDYNGRAIIALPEFLQARKWQDAGSYRDCSFMLGSHTALPMWEYRDKDERCRETFDLGMESEIVAALSVGKAIGSFPFGRELVPIPSVTDNNKQHGLQEELTIVDLGGGHGQALQDIRADHPELLAARFVLMDVEAVILDAITAGLPAWMETVAGSFFEPLPAPIRGAQVYYLRRCLHNWDDAACGILLRNVAAAMDAVQSRLLITDMVIDNTNAVKEMAWEDLNMMTIGGIERTERHWRCLLGDCGFRIHKIWRQTPTEHATIDARLK